MKATATLILLLLTLPVISNAQLNKIANRLKNKAESKITQRIDRRADKALEETLDELEGTPTKNKKTTATQTAENVSQPAASIQSSSKFDFIPGEDILYAEDLIQDAIGELPLHWNTTGKGELVSLKGFSGNWLKMYQNTTYLTANKKEFTKNFTVEFDMILQFNYKSYSFPLVTVGFLSSGSLETTDNELLKKPSKFSCAQLELRPYPNANSSASFYSHVDAKEYFKSTDQKLASLPNNYNKVAHIAMQVQEERLRIWMNNEKVFDIPKALALQHPFNQLFFKIHNSGYTEDQIGFFVSNIKVASGVPDTRHKLIEEGRFSTNGILFATGSAVIEPQSYGIIKEIGNALKENPQVKIKIVGHTSSDGNDNMNMELSKKRADAVKNLLASDYGIDSSRLETQGQGESEPVAGNDTKEGKAQNRRVVFIKL